MAKASLPEVRKAENADWLLLGRAIDRARLLRGWSLKELADAVDRDERQVARWIAGAERPQVDAVFAVVSMRGPLVVALAELADGIDVVTEIRVRTGT